MRNKGATERCEVIKSNVFSQMETPWIQNVLKGNCLKITLKEKIQCKKNIGTLKVKCNDEIKFKIRNTVRYMRNKGTNEWYQVRLKLQEI